MAIKKTKINKEELKMIIKGIAKIHLIKPFEKLSEGILEKGLEIRLKWSNSFLYVYEKNPGFLKIWEKCNPGDVVEIEGYFHARWWPRATSTLPIIERTISLKKIGILE